MLRRITRPLAALADRVERFAETRQTSGQLEPTGPEDTRRLIIAHNAMEARIAALIDEKDVMLGAIGHDLKTPLAALRVRIESVEIIDTNRATVHTCIFDSVVLFDSGQIDGAADDIVFDDSVISAFMVWNVQLNNGTWKWVSSTATQRKIGGDICGFAN